jgi:hypothetical protein
VTVISSNAGAIEENIEYMSDYDYFEVKPNRKFLFYRWFPILSSDDANNSKFQISVKIFISRICKSVVNYCRHVNTIAFSTNEWESIHQEQYKQLVECLIGEVKRANDIRKACWRIAFMFSNQQKNLYSEFSRVMTQLETYQDGFAQIACPMSRKLKQFCLELYTTSYSNDDKFVSITHASYFFIP